MHCENYPTTNTDTDAYYAAADADDAADTDDADDAADDIADEQMNRWEDTRVDTDVFKLLQNGKWSVSLKLFALRSYKVIGTINLKLLNVNKKCK